MWTLFRAAPGLGIVGALVVAGCGSVGGAPGSGLSSNSAGAGSGTGADAGAGVAEAMVVINEAFTAFNFGDVERWVAMRDPGSQYATDEQRAASLDEATRWTRSQMAAGAQFTKIQCHSHGEGEWPGIADSGRAEGHYVTCDAVLSPDTVGGGGEMEFKWVIAHGDVVAVTSGWCVGTPGSSQAGTVEPVRAAIWTDVRQRAGFTLQTGFPYTP